MLVCGEYIWTQTRVTEFDLCLCLYSGTNCVHIVTVGECLALLHYQHTQRFSYDHSRLPARNIYRGCGYGPLGRVSDGHIGLSPLSEGISLMLLVQFVLYSGDYIRN